MIVASDPGWVMPSPTLRSTLAVGTPLSLHGYNRRVQHHELAWVHAALSTTLGRGHDVGGPGRQRAQTFSLLPWQCESGVGVVWWDAADAALVALRSTPSRIGKVPVTLSCGAAVRIHTPPQWTTGAYTVRLTTRTPVAVASSRAEERAYHTTPTAECLQSALVSLAQRLRVKLEAPPVVHVLEDRTRPTEVTLRGKPRRVRGWHGQVDLLCSATARWLLECSARGLGLGARAAYGFGAIKVEQLR
jgi:hypothetical protein